MTTFAYKDGVLAYDSRVTVDGVVYGHINKGLKTDKHLVAVCGDFKAVSIMHAWALTDFDPKEKPNIKGLEFEVLVVDREGVIRLYDNSTMPVVLDDKQYASGSGKSYAEGAMHAGATAKQAVIAAATYDTATGGQVREISFRK